jgi:DNA-binding HxlR family transcriptional regulator
MIYRTHGRGCPVQLAFDLVGGKWKPLILHKLSQGTLRFGELQRCMPHVTQRMLTLQLRELERDGLVRREVFPTMPPRVEYSVTEHAASLFPLLESLADWAAQHWERIGAQRPQRPGDSKQASATA